LSQDVPRHASRERHCRQSRSRSGFQDWRHRRGNAHVRFWARSGHFRNRSANVRYGWRVQPVSATGGLRRRVRSQRAHCGSDHRDDLDPGVAVLRLTPRALDCDDHLLGRIDEDDLAIGAPACSPESTRSPNSGDRDVSAGRYRPPALCQKRKWPGFIRSHDLLARAKSQVA